MKGLKDIMNAIKFSVAIKSYIQMKNAMMETRDLEMVVLLTVD